MPRAWERTRRRGPIGPGPLGGFSIAQQSAAFIASLAPALWFKFSETSGTTVANSGSLAGANGAWSAGAGALGQAGQLGVNQAYSFDDADSAVDVPNIAGLSGITAFTDCFLVKLTDSGEATVGSFYNHGSRFILNFLSGSPLHMSVLCATTSSDSRTNENMTFGAWVWIFNTYDDAGDRKCRLYKGQAGAVTQYTYSVQQAAVGAILVPGSAYVIGNNAARTSTLNGLVDEHVKFNRVLTGAEMLGIVASSGV